jgi:hypothetical protein
MLKSNTYLVAYQSHKTEAGSPRLDGKQDFVTEKFAGSILLIDRPKTFKKTANGIFPLAFLIGCLASL